MTISILGLVAIIVVTAVISFIAAVFVYRNNESLFGPIADRLDAHEDNLEENFRDLKERVELANKRMAELLMQLKK